MPRLAFYTFAILRGPPGDPQVQGFFDRLPDTFTPAQSTPGYITSYDDRPPGTGPRFYDPAVHPSPAHTLSLWADLASVYWFAYRGLHGEALRLRKEWFVKPAWPTYAAWWVSDDEKPTWTDAFARLEHLHDHGPMPRAFTFTAPFDPDGNPASPVRLERGHAAPTAV